MVRFIAKWLKGTEMSDVLLQFSNASFTHSLAREMHVVNARWRNTLCRAYMVFLVISAKSGLEEKSVDIFLNEACICVYCHM